MGKHSENDLFETQGETSAEQRRVRITGARLAALFHEQKSSCALSGLALEQPGDCAVDHIVPVSDGGANDMSNVQILHKKINAMKGTLSQEEFIELCCAVASHSGSRVLAREPVLSFYSSEETSSVSLMTR